MKYMDDIELRVLGRLLTEQDSRGSEIHVFDFDDTLVKTKLVLVAEVLKNTCKT